MPFLKGRFFAVLLAILGLSVASAPARAASMVTNGSFESLLVPGKAAEFGSRYPSQQVTGWTTAGYNFVFTPGSADTTGAIGEYGGVALWGPNNGAANGLPASSPDGGNYLALDGAYGQAPISQTLTGLTPGTSVTVSFYFAGAQQKNYNGATTEQLQVSLGSEKHFTPVLSNLSHGFTGWRSENITFTPTATSEVLSFLAIGTPGGVPPFSLLDGVSIGTPEPATAGLLALSLLGFGAMALVRRRSKAVARASR